MSVDYSQFAINYRLQGVVSAIDSGSTNGFLYLKANSTIVSTISLARPCGTVDGDVLTLDGDLLDPAAAGTGTVTEGEIVNGDGVVCVSGLTVGLPLSGCDIIINNGLNSTVITAGQVVRVQSAEITGS